MDRVYCLNHYKDAPNGNLYTEESERCDSAGLANLANVVKQKDGVSDEAYAEMWHKIVAAIVFYGNVRDEKTQTALQAVIWRYSDGVSLDVTDSSCEREDVFYSYLGWAFEDDDYEQMSAMALAMRDYVNSNFTSVEFENIVINYYAPDNSDFQNLLSLQTTGNTRHVDAGALKVSKEIATGSNADTAQEFTFTVTLTYKEDGSDEYKPYVRNVQVKNEGDADYRTVVPNMNGEIVLTTIGAGEAWLADLAEGVVYSIVEGVVDGWMLIGKSGDAGTIVKDATATAVFTNGEAETSATVRKVWDDEDDKAKKRPSEIVVTLSNGTKVTLSEANGWMATIGQHGEDRRRHSGVAPRSTRHCVPDRVGCGLQEATQPLNAMR